MRRFSSLCLNFEIPQQVLYRNKKVHQVNLSARTGDIGVLADHAPAIKELKPGVVEVIEKDLSKTQLFVPGGYVEILPGSSIRITAVDAIPMSSLDMESIQKEKELVLSKLKQEQNEKEKAMLLIEMDVFEAMQK